MVLHATSGDLDIHVVIKFIGGNYDSHMKSYENPQMGNASKCFN